MEIPFGSIALKTTIVRYPTPILNYLLELRDLAEARDGVIAMHVQPCAQDHPVLLVLSVDTRVIIFQLLDLREKPERLFHNCLFRGKEVTLVGYQIKDGERYGYYTDISEIANASAMRLFEDSLQNELSGFEKLALQVLGVKIPEYGAALRRSNWWAAVLTMEQVEYVSIIAYFAYRIYCRLAVTRFALTFHDPPRSENF